MPNPVEAQELDQNLYDDDDFLSCQPRGVMPLAGTDWRGVDQGNSLPRHLRPTLMTIPTNGQLLETTALPFAVIVQPFAQLRYDEAPIPLVSNWVSGQSAFDAPAMPEEDEGPPRCEKCRGYINPWVRWIDGGRRWQCNLCGASNAVADQYYSHLAPTGQRIDHHERPELLHGTIDFAVPRQYWSEQPAGSLLESATDASAANLASAGDALATTAADLLGGLQTSLGQQPSRGPSPHPGHKGKEKKREPPMRRPQPLGRVFVIDVSATSVKNGVVREACDAIRRALYGSKRKEMANGDSSDGTEDAEEMTIGEGEMIAIISVAESAGFWNLSVSAGVANRALLMEGITRGTVSDGCLGSGRHVRAPDRGFPRRSTGFEASCTRT